MNLTFLGAAREVGRSAVLLECGEKILLDCGIKPAKEPEYPLLDRRTARSLDRVVLSHAHLDHSGYLPWLYAHGYRGHVEITKPTRDLIQLLLADFLRLNRRNCPYAQADADRLLKSTSIREFDEPFRTKATTMRFRAAGHILGAAMAEIHAGSRRIIYSGDIDIRESRLLEGAATGLEADTLILESTYGSRQDKHPSLKATGKGFIDSVNRTLKRGGKVIVPTFAIGRGQEILFTLESYLRSGGLERVPVYLDGMVTRALRIYRHNAIYLKKEIQRRILTSEDDPFKSEFYFIPQRKDRADVFEHERAIILATSGMLNGGPVISYLEKLGADERNKLLLVGFQAAGTQGRELLEGRGFVEHEGRRIDVSCEIEQAPFSGHSDHAELVSFAKSIKGLKNVYVIHGEGPKSYELADAIEESCRGVQAIVPELGETVRI
jgi:predicted metal-dependent RNase